MKLNFTKEQWEFIVGNLRWEYDLEGCECDGCSYARVIIKTIEDHLDVL